MEENKNMIFDDEARQEYYSDELKSGEYFLQNGEIKQKNVMSKEGLDELQKGKFPENAVTVLG